MIIFMKQNGNVVVRKFTDDICDVVSASPDDELWVLNANGSPGQAPFLRGQFLLSEASDNIFIESGIGDGDYDNLRK